jgi:hypothetical protein
MFFKTSEIAGANLYGCTEANVWSRISALALKSNGTLVSSAPAINFLPGQGTFMTVIDTGGELQIIPEVQNGYLATRTEVQNGSSSYCASLSANTSVYTCQIPYTLGAYADGMRLVWKPDMDCLGGATITLDVDSNGAKPVFQYDGASNPASVQCGAGQQILLVYGAALNSGTGGWRILSGSVPPIRRRLDFTFGGQGVALTSGAVRYLSDLPYGCTVQGWSLSADLGTAEVDVWKANDGTRLPVLADSITAGAHLVLSTGSRIRSTNIPGWQTQIAAHSVLAFQLTAVAGGATQVNAALDCQ